MKIIHLTLAVFLASIVVINPLRETPIDDDWAYRLTVNHFLETGEYELHPWAAANFPFQTVWGAAFIQVFGNSFSSLRISTLVLVFLGLIAFYRLAQVLKMDSNVSGLLTLVLLACPLFLKFSFSFMTDIPFLMMMIIAALFYCLAFAKKSLSLAAIASVSCAFAILTRQVGVALLGAVIMYSLLKFRRRQDLPFNLSAVFLPVLASFWQIYQVLFSPNWGMVLNKGRWLLYVSDVPNLLATWLIRPAYLLIYLAVFSFPLLLGAVVYLWRRKLFFPFSITTNYILSSLVIGHLSKWQYVFTFPYLPWGFADIFPQGSLIRPVATIVILFGASVLGGLFLSLRSQINILRRENENLIFIGLIILSLLGYTLIYNGFGDEYLLIFVPFALLILGHTLRVALRSKAIFLMTAGIALVALGATIGLVRNNLSQVEGVWASCEALRLSGIPVRDIYCGFTWTSYYSFDDYIEDTRGKNLTDFTDFFGRYLPNRSKIAKYTVVISPGELDTGWVIQGARAYDLLPSGNGFAYTMKRETKDE